MIERFTLNVKFHVSWSMRPSTQRGSPLPPSAVSTYCRLSSSFSYDAEPEMRSRFDGRKLRELLPCQWRVSSSCAQA